jgi:hypothetical protein
LGLSFSCGVPSEGTLWRVFKVLINKELNYTYQSFLGNRNPYDAANCESDTLNKPIAHILKTYHDLGYRILLVSGRSETHREPTVRWLEKHQIAYEVLLMRAAKDSIVKREIYDQHIALHYNIAFILDDRNQVVDMWRKDLKLPCLQVNYGDF